MMIMDGPAMNARRFLSAMLSIARRGTVMVLLVLACMTAASAQTIPAGRCIDWTLAGVRDTSTAGFYNIDVVHAGLVGDGVTPNDDAMDAILRQGYVPGAIVHFPPGVYLFHRSIRLPSKHVLRGAGPGHTTLIFDLGGAGHAVSITGKPLTSDSSALTENASVGSSQILLDDASFLRAGDWLLLSQYDGDLVTSAWALGTIGQIVRIVDIEDSAVLLASPLRQSYETTRFAKAMLLDMVDNVGIECLTVERRDDTAPMQGCNIQFSYVNNSWVHGVESRNCTFSHIAAQFSSNISISSCSMHHAFSYGGGGRAYGVTLHLASGECLVHDNIFEHLRHSMLLQAGANGNVFAYNFSTDAYWDSGNPLMPSNSAGDMVLHGNYPYANLFEGNICQNIVIDNSHGPNGPYNTFFRNRALLYGIFFSAANSPSQNIVGNEIPNTSLPYRLVNFTIRGAGHFLFGNNNKGSIVPEGSGGLTDTSYIWMVKPLFLGDQAWPGIGTPLPMLSGSIPAYERYRNNELFASICGVDTPLSAAARSAPADVQLYPNPSRFQFTLMTEPRHTGQRWRIIDISGKHIASGFITGIQTIINIAAFSPGLYHVQFGGQYEQTRPFLVY
jgi:hypothetical protein